MASSGTLDDRTEDGRPALRRVMGPGLLLLFIVGDILGTGIYALTGQVAADLGGDLAGERVDPGAEDVADDEQQEQPRPHDPLEGGLAVARALVGDVRGRVVLLVVDATSSLWPVTVAAAVLRRAGADAVLPLLLHRRP